MSHGGKMMLAYISSLLALIVVVVVVYYAWSKDLAGLIGPLGTAFIVLGFYLYAGFDSKDRWPDQSYWERMGSILTFRR